MFSQKKTSKSIIKITDTHISYLTLVKNKFGFFIDNHEMIDLPEGIIVRGEILKADVFSNIIKKMKKHFSNTLVDVILPHDYFLCKDGILDTEDTSKDIKKRIKEYFKGLSKTEDWQRTHVCEFDAFSLGKHETVLFRCLPKDVQKSYVHVLKKSGLKIQSINSELLAYGHLFPDDQVSMIHLGEKRTRVIDFKKGMYTGHKTFALSYEQLHQDIMKNVSLEKDEAEKILNKYGVLRTHKDPQVYARLMRSLTPLLEFFKKRKNKKTMRTIVTFDNMPVLGLADHVSHATHTSVENLNLFALPKYLFQDILTLHKNDSYQYQSHIAQALEYFK
ncbi:MAG: pilus assembly protein PilM [Candidatus Pacebacteria bacterium]|nr:pilus assembly protein PilM [Candidatus Paceibacterota bacterium]